jgi:hypothetical protein
MALKIIDKELKQEIVSVGELKKFDNKRIKNQKN